MPCLLKIIKKRRAIGMGHILRHGGLLYTILESSVKEVMTEVDPERSVEISGLVSVGLWRV